MKIAGNKKKSKNLDTVESSTLEEKKNNNFSSKFLNKKSGITMVALVVTIVVLLILASISIQGITKTGIFRAAEDTKLEHKRASIATTLQTKLKINQTEQIRGTDEEIVKATYEDVKNDLEEIKKAGGKDIEVSEVTSEEKNGKTEWFFEVKVDGDVYKVGLDGSDYLGKEDELAPLIEIKKATATTNAITATVTTRRNEGGKIEYYIKEKGSQKFDLAGTTDQKTFKYTKLKQETTYVIEAVAINTNGKKKVSKEYEIKTSLVPKIDSNEIKFASVPNEWTNKSVEVTATLTVDGQNFTLATSKNPISGWIASNRQIFTENGTMYAALTDGNNYGIAASHEITNIDTTKPIVKSLSVTTNTIKITATDEASGIYSYAISESETMPKTFTKLDNSTQVFNTVVENLKQSTKYYVWVKDVAGNISEVASTKTGTVPKLTDANTTITKSPNDWTTQEVTATVTTTEKNYALQTKKDNGEWQTTNSQKYTENGTIYARLWDGTNAGEEIYKPITNIDKTAPTATNIEIKNVTPAGYDVYVYGVKDNGSGVNRVQFPTWTEAKGQDDIQPNWQTGASSKGTKQADGTTWVYHVNITDHKTEAGEYNTHIYAYDNLENGKCIGTQKVTIPMVKITYDENYVKDGTTNKQTVEKVYNTELGTLRTPTRTGYTFAGWFTEATGGTQISSTTKTPVTDTTYYAHWNANPLNFANQTISKTFSTSEQKADITGASNGTGNYTYTEKTEKNSAQKDTNYISINGTTITIAANTPADTYTYVIVATDNNSKVTKEATYTIKIERAKTANAGASDKTYNGTNQTGVTGTSVIWTGTTSAIDAGTYTANATPDANHAWSDGTTNAKAITWKMNPKSISVTWGTTTTFTYNGQPQAPTASATSGITGETINITRTTETNAGSYTSTASISSVTGGRARKENYTLTGNTKAFTINKANATMTDPTLVTGLVYNTKAQNLIAKAGSGAGGTIKYGLGANSTTAPTSWNTSVTGTNAGTYFVWTKVDADGNHNGVAAKYIGTVTIAKATVTIPTSPVKQYTYNGKAQAHGYTLPTGTAIENNGTTANATDAGTYNIVLKLTSASNYQWSDKTTTNKTINWKINPKSVAVTWGTTVTFTYNGQAQAPTASATSGITGETINITRTTETNAGSYTSTASISSVTGGRARKENYTLTGTTKAFTINKATVATPTNLAISTAGIVTWSSASNATSYQISIDDKNWTNATSGVDYLSTIIGATGNRTVYVRAINSNANNYTTPSGKASKTVAVYTTTINSNSTNMGTVDTSSYNVISGATFTTSGNKLTIKGITSGTTTKDLKVVTATNKTGYSFSKWSVASGTTTAATTITATFTANTYTVAYNGNGATGGSTANTTATYDQSAAIATNGFTRKGYTFAGWTTKTDGTDDGYGWTNWKGTWKYVDGQYGIANRKLQLYARWTPNKYTISYNGNGATGGSTANTTATYDQSAAIATNGFTRTGYTFAGWTTKTDGTDDGYGWTNWKGTWKYVDGQYGIASGKLQLYARWTANQLNFANQTINKTFSTGTQTAGITGASNGTGSYTYTEKSEKNASGTATNYISISGTTINIAASTPAGTYTYVITAKDNNSGVTKDATYTINVARAKNASASASNKTYNGNSQTGVTGGGITWSGTTSGIDAGTYTATATPDGNHAWSDGTTGAKTITWTMNKKTVAVTWGTTTTFNYNGNAQAPTASATSGVTGETINVTRTTGTNAGSYTSTASISSVTGGRAKIGNYALSGNTKAFTINKVAAGNPTLTAVTATYDGKAHYVTVSGGYGGTINYRTSTNNSSWGSWSTTKPSLTNAGVLYVQAYVVGDGNHNSTGVTGSVAITVNKATVTIPGSPVKQYTYNGKAQAHGYTAPSGSSIVTSGTTASATNAGTYNIVLQLANTSNYKWSDGSVTNKTVNWKINKANSTNPTLTAVTANYDGKAHPVTVSGGAGGTINYRTSTNNSSWGSWSTTKPSLTNAGKIYVQAYVVGDANHNNTSATGSVAITINKVNATMANPTLATGLVYNTKAQSLLSKAGSASGGTIKYGLGTNSTTAPTSWNTSVTGTNAGTYFVWTKVDADGNHNGVAAKYIGMVTIAKATITVPGSPVKAYTYKGSAISHGYTAPTGSAIETTGTTGSATDAGTYNIVLKITNTSNYQWNDKTTANKTVNWKINPKSVAVTWGATTTFNYTGRAQAPTASASSGVTGETLNVTRTSAINAGTYTSKASISSVTGGRTKAGNYTLTGNTKSFTINKVAATNPTLKTTTAKYDKNAHAITVSGGSGGTIYYRTSTDNKTWGSWSTTKPTRTSIGTTYVQAYVAGDGNHTNTSATGSATITITKPTAADVSYTPSDSSWKVENVKQALDALYNR